MKWLAILLAALSVFAVAKTDTPQWEVRDDFATILADQGAVGTIVVLDEQEKRWYVTNRERAESPLPPAASFEIFRALAAADASAGPVDARRMDYWLKRADYGNRAAAGPVEAFASNGSLRISARDQVLFLRRLADGELPFTRAAQSTVRDAIVANDTALASNQAVLRGKAGAGAVGWDIGWLERDGRRWFYAVNFDTADAAGATPQVDVARKALAAVGALEG